jgi:PAS domain S-box-containing protein
MNGSGPVDHASALLAAIVESSDDAIVSKTLNGQITSWNAGAIRLFGYTPDEVIGKSILILLPKELVHEEAEILSRVRGGLRVEHYSTRRLRKDGKLVDVSITVSPVRDANGTIVGASKIARDITAQKLAASEREQLLESERAARSEAERLSHVKDEFLATLSHELRTPLNAILGWCQLLREPSFRSANQTKAIDTIERNARAQAQIIDDLLDLSRIISGKIQLAVAPLRVEEAVRLAVDVVQPSATAKRIDLSVRFEPGGAIIYADSARLQQILWNLLTNAVKFTPQRGTIKVLVRNLDDKVEVSVADSGIGISAEFLPQVFHRFRQAQTGMGRQYGGLGIGLSIVRNLVELHGGSISVFSQGENTGSTFSMMFARVTAEDGEKAVETPISAPPRRLAHRRILVLDDDPDGRDLLALLLEEHGASVTQASCAADALDYLQSERFDVLVSDIGMPGIDGYQLIQQIRGSAPAVMAGIPAIALSAYARPEDSKRSLAAGFQVHIAKPYSVSGLLDAVQIVLNENPASASITAQTQARVI